MIENHNRINLEQKPFEDGIKDDFGLEIKNSKKVEIGYSSQVYKAELNSEPVFIRINKNPRVFEVEQLGYKMFKEKNIPVPKIIAYKENPPSIKLPTIIMTSAEGISLSEANLSIEEKNIVYKKVGTLLKKIHETKLEGFGALKVVDNQLKGTFETWKEYSEYQDEYNLNALEYVFSNKFINEEEASKIKGIYKEVHDLDFGKASLLHKDIHHGHIFVKGTDITGIIDLGALMAGDPRYDIAMSLIHINPEQQEYLKKGYGELAYDPIVDKHLISIAIRKIFFRTRQEIKGDIEPILSVLRDALKKDIITQ
jgi:aminoglycoside phosphotransferase (APT) family kinase protein